ncbi:ammonium transporter [Prosthecobacter sp.]|jgi:Amt family ammonium transporter|uniref:ammonium transporter n=1 Tax=Prosthecobacter sp. TaxID=1965333 RepID=UPI00378526F3
MLKLNHTRTWRSMAIAAVVALTSLAFTPGDARGQDAAAPAPAPAAAPAAPAPAAPSLDDVVKRLDAAEKQLGDHFQYFNNLAPSGDGKLAGLPGPGHNGFLMICAALVLFMTLPGLALFYGGLVRSKNVLSVVAQCFGIAGLVTILWYFCGFSLVFGEHPAEGAPSWASYLGSFKYFFLEGVGGAPNGNYTGWPSFSVFAMYQLMFAIITPALIVGAIAERMKFSAIMLFVTLWMFIVYFPLAHMVWGFDGLMNGVWNGGAKIPAIDFAGGTVVHMSSGWSALVLCLLLGKRAGYGKEKMAPHSMVLCAVGTGMLWVGWYGFNAGSALAADGIAANAFMTTTLAAATACFVWAVVEKIHKGKPSVLGFCSGAVAGLVVITPAAGFVNAKAAMIIGVLAGIIPYLGVMVIKPLFKYDDALDTFGVHGIGGTLGAIVTGIFATKDVNANLISEAYAKVNGLDKLVTEGGLLGVQLKACAITIVLSVVATVVITLIVKVLTGLRPAPEEESVGLDLTDHGEAGYEH